MHRTAMSLLLLASAASTGAQVRFSSSAELVVLSATAIDGKGRPVRDLRAEEFRVYEEGRPQTIRHFVGGPEVPARVLLLVDASGSMGSELKVTSGRMAAHQLLDALPAAPDVEPLGPREVDDADADGRARMLDGVHGRDVPVLELVAPEQVAGAHRYAPRRSQRSARKPHTGGR